MSDESPPPYSAVAATLPVAQIAPSWTALPFAHSDRLALNILGLVSEGKTLDSRFKDIRDGASAGAKFEYQHTALALCQRFEALVWGSRNIAGVALVAIKDFNEIVLDFLSEPGVAVEDRLKELAGASRLLQRERDSAKNQKYSFDALTRDLEDFHRAIYIDSGILNPKRRRQSHSGDKGTRGTRPLRKSRPPIVVPRSEPINYLSTVTASFGAFSRTCMDYALQFENKAERAVFPSLVSSPPEAAQETSSAVAVPNPSQRKRICPLITENAGLETRLDVVGALVGDLSAFASCVDDAFNTVLTELAREQDIIVLYLKDGQSVANQGYRFEINRLRRHLPRVCNALDAYSKGRL